MSTVEYLLLCSIGNSRTNQEDNFFLCSGEHLNPESAQRFAKDGRELVIRNSSTSPCGVFAVCDGMGGHACGEVASYMVASYLAQNSASWQAAPVQTVVEDIAQLNRAVEAAGRENPAQKGMGSTLCGVTYSYGMLHGFNVGDSRLYSFYKGELKQLSRDHTEGQRLLDLKLLTEQELSSFPHRKGLYKYIGTKSELIADAFEIGPARQGELLLLCSDGLTDALCDGEITQILYNETTLEGRGGALLSQAIAKNPGHGDNITVILIEF